MTQFINTEVDVNAYYFAGKDLKTFPRQIEFGGQAVTFADGLRLHIQSNGHTSCLYDMSALDGGVYRLRHENNRWTLVGRI